MSMIPLSPSPPSPTTSHPPPRTTVAAPLDAEYGDLEALRPKHLGGTFAGAATTKN